MIYDPPLSLDKIKELYPDKIYHKLKNDPVHRWRAETGIELIHREPDFDEQIRIWKNWNLMNDEQKKISDEKSLELFGITNVEHHRKIMDEVYPNRKFDVVYENIMTEIASYCIFAAPMFVFENPKTFKNIPIENKMIYETFKKNFHFNLLNENRHEELQIGNSALGYIKSKISNYISKIDLNVFENRLSKNWMYFDAFKNANKQDLYILKFDFSKPNYGLSLILKFIGDRFSNDEKNQFLNDIKGSLNTAGLFINLYFSSLIILNENNINDETILHELYHYMQALGIVKEKHRSM